MWRAICDAMTLRLSPCVTAAKASARSMPARRKTSTSIPFPTIVVPENSGSSRRNARAETSRTVTSWPPCESCEANLAPTRPQPMIMMNIADLSFAPEGSSLLLRNTCAADPDLARRILQHVGRGSTEIEFAGVRRVRNPDDDEVSLGLDRFLHDG